MQSKDIKLGVEYAYNNSPTYGSDKKVKVVEVVKVSQSSWGAKDHPERIGKTSYYRDQRYGKWKVVVTGDLRYRGDEDETHVVDARAILHTWDEELANRKREGEAKHQANLVKKQHNEVTDLRYKQLAELFGLYGIEVEMRITPARYTGHNEIRFEVDDDKMAELISKLTDILVTLPPYPGE